MSDANQYSFKAIIGSPRIFMKTGYFMLEFILAAIFIMDPHCGRLRNFIYMNMGK